MLVKSSVLAFVLVQCQRYRHSIRCRRKATHQHRIGDGAHSQSCSARQQMLQHFNNDTNLLDSMSWNCLPALSYLKYLSTIVFSSTLGPSPCNRVACTQGICILSLTGEQHVHIRCRCPD